MEVSGSMSLDAIAQSLEPALGLAAALLTVDGSDGGAMTAMFDWERHVVGMRA
jgi:hypothetical protein